MSNFARIAVVITSIAVAASAAQAQGIPVSIFVPSSISSVKEKKISDCGARLIKVEGGPDNAEREAASMAQAEGEESFDPSWLGECEEVYE